MTLPARNPEQSSKGTGAFQAIAGYIFGGNDAGEKIAMTTPVLTTRGGTMQFMMPSVYTVCVVGLYLVFLCVCVYTWTYVCVCVIICMVCRFVCVSLCVHVIFFVSFCVCYFVRVSLYLSLFVVLWL